MRRAVLGGPILAGALGASACAPEPSERPNVVLVVLDTVRRDRLSCYGYARPTTPGLEALAREAVVFEHAVSAAPWTLPSHASIFTGLRPSSHQAHHEHLGLDASRTTMAEHLAGLGYETFGVSNNPWVSGRTGLAQGFEAFAEPWRARVAKDTFALNVFPDEERHGLSDAGAESSYAAIAGWLGERDPARPYFLFVNLIEAHAYYAAPEPFRSRFSERELSMDEVRAANFDFLRQAGQGRLAPAVARRVQDLYDGELAYLDAWIARLVELLRSRGELDRTLFVLTSDHGEAFGDHARCDVPLVDHQLSLHEELLAVPLLVRFPAASEARRGHGTRVTPPVSTLDLLPTVLDVVGAVEPAGLEGRSLSDLAPPALRPLVSEYYRPLAHLDVLARLIGDEERIACLADRRVTALRTGSRKVVLDTRGEVLGFDLASDPAEARALDAEALPTDEVGAARRNLECMQAGFDVPPPAPLDEAQAEALRALGYF